VSFAIANNLLTPNIRAIDLRISPQAIVVVTTWNNFKNLKDGSFNMKHLERYSYTIPKNPPEDKTHPKINREQWLKLGETKSYLEQRCV
jgi:hypothetical protein